MKKIKYYLKVQNNTGTEDAPVWEDAAGPLCILPYSVENLAAAEAESFGAVSIEDDGIPEPEPVPSQEERLAALEAAMLEMILGGDG